MGQLGMNKEDIIRLAREAGFADGVVEIVGLEGFSRFADLVAKAERHRIYEMLIKMHTQEERHNYYLFIANIIKESA